MFWVTQLPCLLTRYPGLENKKKLKQVIWAGGSSFYLLGLNPLSLKSDEHEISPYNINALENRVVMRIEYMIREDESN